MRELARDLPVKTPKRALVHATIREQGLAPTTDEALCFWEAAPEAECLRWPYHHSRAGARSHNR